MSTIEDDVAKIAFIPDRIEGHLFTTAWTDSHYLVNITVIIIDNKAANKITAIISQQVSVLEITYLPSYDDFSTVRAYEAYESIL